jgi:hypothetical protein
MMVYQSLNFNIELNCILFYVREIGHPNDLVFESALRRLFEFYCLRLAMRIVRGWRMRMRGGMLLRS